MEDTSAKNAGDFVVRLPAVAVTSGARVTLLEGSGDCPETRD